MSPSVAASNGNGSSRSSPTVAIVGAGFSGLGMAIQLKRAGFDSLTILEKAGDVGGVWRENTYPGATCDVPSHLYSYSFEPNHSWSRVFSPQPEILNYLQGCVRKYGLTESLRLGAEVTGAEFDRDAGRWRIAISTGETVEADVLVTACGQLSRPAYPQIPGLDSFAGRQFHSARWEHDFDLAGKRVAVIGTGASAIQFVPAIAPEVTKLYVFQRSAPVVIPKKDRPYRRWEKALFRRLPFAQSLHRLWIWLIFEIFVAAFNRIRRLMSIIRRMFERQLAEQVADPALRSALTPDYEIGCKRILISSEYYAALTRPNVELVTDPVREVTPAGVRTEDGAEREVDAIILGTGFLTNEFLAPIEVRGLAGRDLNEAWRDGAEAYLGITVAGFPNFFILYGPNTNLGSGSIIYMLESQFRYVVEATRELARNGADYIDVRDDAQSAFSREVQRRLEGSVWMTGCTSWYVNEAGRNTNNWPGFMTEYRRRTRKVELSDYRLVRTARAG